EPGLRRLGQAPDGSWRVSRLDAGGEGGARGLALSPDGALAYVASPPIGGIKVVSLAGTGLVQVLTTGLSPRTLRVVPAGTLPGERRGLLLVSNFTDRKVTVHPIGADGRLEPPAQTIATEAPVLDMVVAGSASGPSLLLFTHEDRPL